MALLIFVFGTIIGSFLNALIYRLHSGESITATSSRCPNCGHNLAWTDLIPVVSFFWLKRRCRYCQKPISWQYPVVELVTGLAFALIYVHNVIPAQAGIQWIPGASPRMTGYMELLFQFVFASFLIVIFVYDLKHYLILDKVVFPAAALAGGYQLWQGDFWPAVAGAAGLAGFFGLLYVVSRGRWIGLGDMKLGAFLGFLVPWPQTLVVFFVAYFVGALVSVILLLAQKKKMRDQLPFGTFLTFAAFIAMLWGEPIIKWYFHLIGLGQL